MKKATIFLVGMIALLGATLYLSPVNLFNTEFKKEMASSVESFGDKASQTVLEVQQAVRSSQLPAINADDERLVAAAKTAAELPTENNKQELCDTAYEIWNHIESGWPNRYNEEESDLALRVQSKAGDLLIHQCEFKERTDGTALVRPI